MFFFKTVWYAEYIYIYTTCHARICTVYTPWIMTTGILIFIMGYEFNSCGILQLKMQDWVGRVTLCIGEIFHERDLPLQKGRWHSTILFAWGFSSPLSLDIFCRSLCGFIGGLGAAAILFLAWILSQGFASSALHATVASGFGTIHTADFISVVFLCVTFGSISRYLFWLLHILTIFRRHGCSSRTWWFRLIALTWPWERRPLGCSAILNLGLFPHRHCSYFHWHPLHQILCLLILVFFDGPEA